MLNGTDFWDDTVKYGIVTMEAEPDILEVYGDAPLSLYASLERSSKLRGQEIALVVSNGESVTYAELFAAVNRFATSDLGKIQPGERVLLLLDTSVEFVIALMAINRQLGVAVPVSTKLRDPELDSLIQKSGAMIGITEEQFRPVLERHISKESVLPKSDARAALKGNAFELEERENTQAPTPSAESAALLIFTSGTTAASKGVLLSNQNISHAIVAYERVLGLTQDDVGILPVPIFYVTGLVALLGVFVHLGGRLVLHERFDPDLVLESVRANKVTYIHASPTVFSLLLEHSEGYPSLPSVRLLASGAAHMPVKDIEAMSRWLPAAQFRTVYGLTETSSPATIMPEDASTSRFAGSSGRPIPGLRIEIRDDSANEVPMGEVGAIWLSGTNVAKAYDGISDESLIRNGWLNSGDLGFLNGEGYLFIVDRTKSMINRGGEKIWCIDVEEALREIPGVADAAVVGIPHAVYGEEPAALVVPKSDSSVTPDDIPRLLREKIASFQVPRRVVFADSIPLTTNLKVDKGKIQKLFGGLGT